MPWSPEEREAIVARYHAAADRISDLQFDLGGLAGEAKARAIAEVGALSDELYGLVTRYKAGLPHLAVSRCPFTNEPAIHSLDAHDLRGMWWRAERPARPLVEPHAGRTFVALTGAMRLASPVERTEFVAQPGPGVPFIKPSLLRRPEVKATLSSFAIGRHTGFVIVYFSSQPIALADRPTIWGTQVPDLDPNYRWDDYMPDDHRQWDFALAPWLHSGKLSWIAPGDPSLALRSGLSGCPYVDLEGPRRVQYVSVGKVMLSSLGER
jgi:hypothetical protein